MQPREPEPGAGGGETANERGIALLLVLFVLTTLTIVALYLGSSASINRRIAGDELTESKALRYAESGVCEAMARIESGLGPDPTVVNAPRKVVQVLNTSVVGVVGADTTLVATGQASGARLTYSSATAGPNALTIAFRTNPARTQLYRYDKSKQPPVQTASGAPIYRITSTGRVGSVRRTIVAEVIWVPVNFNIKGGLAAGQDVKFTGTAVVCGYDHRADTPIGTGAAGRAGLGGCNVNPAAVPPQWEFPAGSLAGIWSIGDASGSGAANAFGTPPTSNLNVGFYAGPWAALGLSQSQFYAWVGTPQATMPAAPSGITYLDNDATKQNASGSWTLVDGSGLLYVDGDLTLQANWRGLIYVEGNLKLNGNAWVLGAIIVKGSPVIVVNGNSTVLYSSAALQQYVAGSGRTPAMLSWSEQ